MRIAFLGTPEFALPSLSALIERGYTLCVFTQPDKPVGRKAVLTPPPVKVLAEQHGIPVYQFEKIRSFDGCEALVAFQPDLCVTAAFGQLLSKKNLSIPKQGTINVHGSLLPKYRGASPIQSAIINGETHTGVTTMMTDIGMDTGDILLKKETAIGLNETYAQLSERLAVLGAELLTETLDRLENGSLIPIPQDESEATCCHVLTRENGRIDFHKTAKEIHNLVRGTNPWPTAYAYLGDEMLKVYETQLTECHDDLLPGSLISKDDRLFVQCADDLLEVISLQMSGKKRMNADAFLRGCSLNGKRLC